MVLFWGSIAVALHLLVILFALYCCYVFSKKEIFVKLAGVLGVVIGLMGVVITSVYIYKYSTKDTYEHPFERPLGGSRLVPPPPGMFGTGNGVPGPQPQPGALPPSNAPRN